MRKLAKVLVVALCIALAVSVAGCKLPKAKAKKKVSIAADTSVQGDITVYTSVSQEQSDKYVALFNKEYPNVKVAVVSDTPAAIAAKLIKEKKAPVADVVWHTPLSAVYASMEASTLATYAYHPGQIDAVDPNWVDGEHAGAVYWAGTDASLVSWVVNASKSGGNSPAAFADLIDPKYAGMIEAPSINTDAGYTMVASLLSNMDEADGWNYLDQLDKNVTYYSDDPAAPAKDAAAGNVAVGIGFDNAVVAAASSGGGAQAVFPGQPQMSPYDIDVDALVDKPSPSTAAKTFLDWGISDNAMNAYAAQTPITSVDEGNLPQGYPAAISDQLMQAEDFSYLADNHDKIVTEWMKRYGKKIKTQ